MNHKHPVEQEEVMAFVDGQLEAEHAATVERHLAECAECKALEAELRRVSEQAQAWQVEAASAALKQKVTAALTKDVPKKRFLFLPPLVWQLGAAAAVLLLVISLSIPNLLRSPSRQVEGGVGVATDQQPRPPAPVAAQQPRAAATEHKVSSFSDKERFQAVGPMVIRTASLVVVTKEFEKARTAMEAILRKHGGHFAQLESSDTPGNRRSVNATMRVPATKLDDLMAELKKLGRVENESQRGDEVTEEYVDLTARLTNARNTEKRLTQVLENRTGKVKDVLEVEREIARVREEIEQMDAQRKNLENRVEFATVQLRLLEEYEAQINPPQPSAWLMVRDAAVEGFRSVRESALGLLLFVLSYGPTLLFWGAILFWPVRFAWRRMRAASVA